MDKNSRYVSRDIFIYTLNYRGILLTLFCDNLGGKRRYRLYQRFSSFLDCGTLFGLWHPFWTVAPFLDRCTLFGPWHPFWTVAPFLDCGTLFGPWHTFWTVAPFLDCGNLFGLWNPFWTVAPFLDCGTLFQTNVSRNPTRIVWVGKQSKKRGECIPLASFSCRQIKLQ